MYALALQRRQRPALVHGAERQQRQRSGDNRHHQVGGAQRHQQRIAKARRLLRADGEQQRSVAEHTAADDQRVEQEEEDDGTGLEPRGRVRNGRGRGCKRRGNDGDGGGGGGGIVDVMMGRMLVMQVEVCAVIAVAKIDGWLRSRFHGSSAACEFIVASSSSLWFF